MGHKAVKLLLFRCLTAALLLGLWQLATLFFPPMVVPPIPNVTARLVQIITGKNFLSLVGTTLLRLLTGLGIGVALGSGIGLIFGLFKPLEDIFAPFISILQTVPPVCWVVLALVWFGFNGKPCVFIVATATIPTMVINLSSGVRSIDHELIEMAHMYHFSKRKTVFHVILPSIQPHFRSALEIVIGGGWKLVVMGEVLTTSTGVGGAALLVSILCGSALPIDPAWISIILCGIPIILEAVIGLVTAFDIKADVLVSLALIASVVIGENFAAGEVAFIMQLGALLEDLTVAKARAGIEKLVHLTPRTARVLKNGSEAVIPAEQVKVGDLLRVLPGETVPVDGVIQTGTTSIDQAVMTGESLPVDKGVGDEVSSGTVNQFGSFDMEATKVGEDSSIQRMIRLVQSADAGKAKIVGLADRWATWVVVIALSAAVLTWLLTHQIIRSVTILVVFCPCALVLATPTAIMAAIGNATKHGFLVREGDALERLAKVSKFTFDKTGTLTYGTPKVVAVRSFSADISEGQLYFYAASAESWSEHPLGRAIVNCYRGEIGAKALASERFRMLPGRGVEAVVDGKAILAGNTELLSEHDAVLPGQILDAAEQYLGNGCTIIFVAVDGEAIGILALSDTLRPSAADTIEQIKKIGVDPVLLTGDNDSAARYIAGQLGITEIRSNCLPEDKLNCISSYQSEEKQVCMIGDGINDAPALKKAYVGIAMGGVGSDIAVDAADIALVNDDIKEIPHLLRLAKRMMLTIKCNLTFSMTLNFVAIILAINGTLNPVVGALVHNAGSVFVIINSALLLKWRKYRS